MCVHVVVVDVLSAVSFFLWRENLDAIVCGIHLEFQEYECSLLLTFRAGIELSGSTFGSSHLRNDLQVVVKVFLND